MLCAVDAEGVARVPEYLSDVQAKRLPCAALTAWSALVTYGAVKAGDRVLVQGTGGVSTFAFQVREVSRREHIDTQYQQRGQALRAGAPTPGDDGLDYRATPKDAAAAGEALQQPRRRQRLRSRHRRQQPGAGARRGQARGPRERVVLSLIGVLSGSELALKLGPIVDRHVRLERRYRRQPRRLRGHEPRARPAPDRPCRR